MANCFPAGPTLTDAQNPSARTPANRSSLCRSGIPLRGVDGLRAGGVLGLEEAELVALRVGEHDPKLFALADIHAVSSHSQEAVDFSGLVVRVEIQMQAALGDLGVKHRHKGQAWQPVRSGPDRVLVLGLSHDRPAESVRPPSPQHNGVRRVDDDVLPLKTHGIQSMDPPFVSRRGATHDGGRAIEVFRRSR